MQEESEEGCVHAAVWAFGGTLDVEHRESFSNWWRTQFDQHIDYPEDGTVSALCVCVCVCVCVCALGHGRPSLTDGGL